MQIALSIPTEATGPRMPGDFVGRSYEVQEATGPRFFSAQNSDLIREFKELSPTGALRLGRIAASLLTGSLPPIPPNHNIHRCVKNATWNPINTGNWPIFAALSVKWMNRGWRLREHVLKRNTTVSSIAWAGKNGGARDGTPRTKPRRRVYPVTGGDGAKSTSTGSIRGISQLNNC